MLRTRRPWNYFQGLFIKFISSYTIVMTCTFYKIALQLICLLLLLISCNDNVTESKAPLPTAKKNKRQSIKPPATFQDTLLIDFSAAVFYYPDSVQLQKIKAETDTMTYNGLMHEYFYQMRNAAGTIKKNWPGLLITHAKKYRFLLFKKNNGSSVCLDLDTKNDPYGLIVFNRQKDPLLADMTNLETDISFYLK